MEAYADFVSGQVTSIANYKWLGGGQDPHVCSVPTAACYDGNFWQDPAQKNDGLGISRMASLMHDAFDGNTDEYSSNVPDNADAWKVTGILQDAMGNPILDSNGNKQNSYGFTPTSWGSKDPAANGGCRANTGDGFTTVSGGKVVPVPCVGGENAQIAGPAFVDMTNSMAHFAQDILTPISFGTADTIEYIDDAQMFQAVDRTMYDYNVSWCDRCAVLALHSPGNSGDNLSAQGLLQQCWSGPWNSDSFLVGNELPFGTPPDPDLRLEMKTCKQCPDGYFSDDSGICQVCYVTLIGNQCIPCQSDVVIDGSTAPFSNNWDSSMVTLANDNCPQWFWVEIDNADKFFGRGAASVHGTLFPTPCDGPVTLGYQRDDRSRSGQFQTLETITQNVTTQSGSFFQCINVPQVTFNSAGDLPTPTVRFGTPAVPGITLEVFARGPGGATL